MFRKLLQWADRRLFVKYNIDEWYRYIHTETACSISNFID